MTRYSLLDFLPFSVTVKTLEGTSLALLTSRTIPAAFSLLLTTVVACSTNPASFGRDFECCGPWNWQLPFELRGPLERSCTTSGISRIIRKYLCRIGGHCFHWSRIFPVAVPARDVGAMSVVDCLIALKLCVSVWLLILDLWVVTPERRIQLSIEIN